MIKFENVSLSDVEITPAMAKALGAAFTAFGEEMGDRKTVVAEEGLTTQVREAGEADGWEELLETTELLKGLKTLLLLKIDEFQGKLDETDKALADLKTEIGQLQITSELRHTMLADKVTKEPPKPTHKSGKQPTMPQVKHARRKAGKAGKAKTFADIEEGSTPKQQEIIAILRKELKISTSALAEAVGLSNKGVGSNLAGINLRCKRAGFPSPIGGGRGTIIWNEVLSVGLPTTEPEPVVAKTVNRRAEAARKKGPVGETRNKLITLLKGEGWLSLNDVASLLEVTDSTVRSHAKRIDGVEVVKGKIRLVDKPAKVTKTTKEKKTSAQPVTREQPTTADVTRILTGKSDTIRKAVKLVRTEGTISVHEAVNQLKLSSGRSVNAIMMSLKTAFEKEGFIPPMARAEDEATKAKLLMWTGPILSEKQGRPLTDLNIDARTHRALERNGYNTVDKVYSAPTSKLERAIGSKRKTKRLLQAMSDLGYEMR